MGERFRDLDEEPNKFWPAIGKGVLRLWSIKEHLTGESGRYIEAVAGLYLHNLGLSWGQLAGQEILDIGAAGAEFAQAARKRHIKVQSLDIVRGGMGGTRAVPQGVPYDIWDAREGLSLYPNERYDIVLCHGAMAAIVNGKDENGIKSILNDFVRVLRPGGELRFGPNPIHFRPWTPRDESKLQWLREHGSHDEYLRACLRKEYDTLGQEQLAGVQQARHAGFIEEDARLIHPDLEVHFLSGDQQNSEIRVVDYYRLRKPGDASRDLPANP